MEITEIRITLREDEKLRGFASITLDDCFVIRGLKIIEGANGMFVAMPNRKRKDGSFQDIAHPINAQTREWMESQIVAAYKEELPAPTERGVVRPEKKGDWWGLPAWGVELQLSSPIELEQVGVVAADRLPPGCILRAARLQPCAGKGRTGWYLDGPGDLGDQQGNHEHQRQGHLNPILL